MSSHSPVSGLGNTAHLNQDEWTEKAFYLLRDKATSATQNLEGVPMSIFPGKTTTELLRTILDSPLADTYIPDFVDELFYEAKNNERLLEGHLQDELRICKQELQEKDVEIGMVKKERDEAVEKKDSLLLGFDRCCKSKENCWELWKTQFTRNQVQLREKVVEVECLRNELVQMKEESTIETTAEPNTKLKNSSRIEHEQQLLINDLKKLIDTLRNHLIVYGQTCNRISRELTDLPTQIKEVFTELSTSQDELKILRNDASEAQATIAEMIEQEAIRSAEKEQYSHSLKSIINDQLVALKEQETRHLAEMKKKEEEHSKVEVTCTEKIAALEDVLEGMVGKCREDCRRGLCGECGEASGLLGVHGNEGAAGVGVEKMGGLGVVRTWFVSLVAGIRGLA